jgi:hypothetical protein
MTHEQLLYGLTGLTMDEYIQLLKDDLRREQSDESIDFQKDKATAS